MSHISAIVYAQSQCIGIFSRSEQSPMQNIHHHDLLLLSHKWSRLGRPRFEDSYRMRHDRLTDPSLCLASLQPWTMEEETHESAQISALESRSAKPEATGQVVIMEMNATTHNSRVSFCFLWIAIHTAVNLAWEYKRHPLRIHSH